MWLLKKIWAAMGDVARQGAIKTQYSVKIHKMLAQERYFMLFAKAFALNDQDWQVAAMKRQCLVLKK